MHILSTNSVQNLLSVSVVVIRYLKNYNFIFNFQKNISGNTLYKSYVHVYMIMTNVMSS